jgi:hypothetical protein
VEKLVGVVGAGTVLWRYFATRLALKEATIAAATEVTVAVHVAKPAASDDEFKV